MSGYLLDTNIISEVTKPSPEPRVIDFLYEQHDLWISAITLHELAFGIGLMPGGQRRSAIEDTIAVFTEAYQDRIIAVDRDEADCAAALRAQAQKSGKIVQLGDALIAGTAKAHGLAVVTRNVSDFKALDIPLVNPWQA